MCIAIDKFLNTTITSLIAAQSSCGGKGQAQGLVGRHEVGRQAGIWAGHVGAGMGRQLGGGRSGVG